MPYRVDKSGLVECDTIDELRALAQLGLFNNGQPVKARPARSSKQAEGIKQSWEKARKLASKEGISVKEARSRLKAEK